MSRTLCRLFGVAFVLAGLAGFADPRMFGLHLTAIHDLIHVFSGLVLLYVGFAGSEDTVRGAMLTFGTMNVHTVPISHDATEPIGVVATDIVSGARAAVVLDLGRMTPQLRDAIRDLDILVLESNHDEAMLARGPYPISVQRRIAGASGHLSNRDAAMIARTCAHSGLQHLVLAHHPRHAPALAALA